MAEAITLLGFVSALGAVVYGWRKARLRRVVRERLGATAPAAPLQAELAPAAAARERPFDHRRLWWPILLGVAVAAGLYLGLGWHYSFCLTFGLMTGLLGGLAETTRLARRQALIERQLSDAIDLMVGALRAGGSVSAALEGALVETRQPLRAEVQEVLGRLRLGDNPLAVFRGLARRVPLETFRLFAATLATHWEVGGSLAPTLATVGRTIRDRIEVARRINSLTTQSRVSTIAVLGATYFIALVMWRNEPERFAEFLSTDVGRMLVIFGMLLQAVGIVWASSIGKLKI